VLVKDARMMLETFSHHPDYYEFGMEGKEINYYEYGLQNSRGFRALKVWLSFQILGKNGFIKLIEKDIHLSRLLVEKMSRYSAIIPFMNSLSITTFSYIPEHFQGNEEDHQDYLNDLNKKILQEVQKSGEAFISNAMINGKYLLRACLVNFRTREEDLDILLDLTSKIGKTFEGETEAGMLPGNSEFNP
jgi:glutamate/tyrosine decarboxylase-like PLP-dependent enzyme